MKKNIFRKASVGIGLGLALLPFLALAQVPIVPETPLIESPWDITIIIQDTLNWIAGIVFVIALIMLIWSAILYLTAGGSEDRVKRAKNYLIYAIVGVAVALLAYSVVPFLTTVLGGQF